MDSDYRSALMLWMLETVDRLEDGHEIIKLAHYEYTLDQVREVISDCIDVEFFILKPHVDNDGLFMVALAGLSRFGKETLADLREETSQSQEVSTARLYSAWKRIPENERIPYREWIRDMYSLDEEIEHDEDGTTRHQITRKLTDKGRAKLTKLEG